MDKKLIGVTIATAAALTFASSPLTSAFAQGAMGDVKCYGINSCKGQSACKTTQNPSGPGKNSCKGQGLKMVSSEKDCTDAGGKLTE